MHTIFIPTLQPSLPFADELLEQSYKPPDTGYL